MNMINFAIFGTIGMWNLIPALVLILALKRARSNFRGWLIVPFTATLGSILLAVGVGYDPSTTVWVATAALWLGGIFFILYWVAGFYASEIDARGYEQGIQSACCFWPLVIPYWMIRHLAVPALLHGTLPVKFRRGVKLPPPVEKKPEWREVAKEE